MHSGGTDNVPRTAWHTTGAYEELIHPKDESLAGTMGQEKESEGDWASTLCRARVLHGAFGLQSPTLPSLPLAQPTPGALAALRSLRLTKLLPTSRPLHLLAPLLHKVASSIQVSPLKWHLPRQATPSTQV